MALATLGADRRCTSPRARDRRVERERKTIGCRSGTKGGDDERQATTIARFMRSARAARGKDAVSLAGRWFRQFWGSTAQQQRLPARPPQEKRKQISRLAACSPRTAAAAMMTVMSEKTSCIVLKQIRVPVEKPVAGGDTTSKGNVVTLVHCTTATKEYVRHTSDISSFPRNKSELGADRIPIITALAGTWIRTRVKRVDGRAGVNISINVGGGTGGRGRQTPEIAADCRPCGQRER